MITNPALENILKFATDISIVCEIYSADTTPGADGFDPADALDCFAKVSGITFRGKTYKRLVRSFGSITRTITEKTNSAQVTFDNLSREISDFEFNTGFEGLILVIRLLSRSQSVALTDSQILFVGRCEQPKSGTKERLTVTANFILSSLDTEIPRRKFAPEDHEGRTPGDILFEGFRFMPQYGVTTYNVRVRRGGLLGLLGFKKTVTRTLQYSSYSDLDAERSVPEAFGRVQLAGVHMAYSDIGTSFRTATAFCEGEIEGYINIRSATPQFPLTSYAPRYGKLGGVDEQVPNPIPDWVGNGYYSRTAYIYATANGSAVEVVEPAPDIVAVILGKKILTPDEFGVWNTTVWTDNPAAVVRFLMTSDYYYKLNENWLDNDSFLAAYRFNDEMLFDLSYSDFLFVPDSLAGAFKDNLIDGETGNYFLPTSSVRPGYWKYLNKSITASDYFLATAATVADSYDPTSGLIPIEPPEIPEPIPGSGTSLGLLYFLRRRYTCNVAVTEQTKIIDFLHKVIFPASRMFFTQGANGKIKLNHKKPVDWALATDQINSSTIAVDDVTPWLDNKSGHLLIDPNTSVSEIRDVVGAAYSLAQNSVALSASANIAVTGFSGSDGDQTPATATLTVLDPDPGNVSNFDLDGEEISFVASDDDTVDTVAAFIYASVNAHPRLKRRFSAELSGDQVTITAKFGTLQLDEFPDFTHDAPLADPSAAPTLTAAAGGTFAAGIYRVAYAFENSHGQTLLSPFKAITLTANQKIQVSAVTLPAGADSVVWYVTPAGGSARLRFHSRNDGSAFEITTLPLLTAPLPPDLNRTGTEVMRVAAVFSDRGLTRAHISRSNVLKASFEWILGNREKAVNRIDLKYRDATQDWRLLELRLKDDAHIAKTKKISNLEVNGQAIDNYNQAYRIAASMLAELRDADFFERWSSTREALLLEEGDVVAVTDSGAGFINLPVRIEEIQIDPDGQLPKVSFTARKYSTTLYDDSVAERQIPVITETESADYVASRSVSYAPTNFSGTRALDASVADLAEVADALATVMDDLENGRK